MSLGEWFLIFKRNVVPSLSRGHLALEDEGTLSKPLGTTHPRTHSIIFQKA